MLVGAVSWPAFEGWFQGHRLRQGIDSVRTLWVKGRTAARWKKAGRTGFAWRATGYRLAPDGLEDWPDLAGGAFPPSSSGPGYTPGLVVEEALPQGVQFLAETAARWARAKVAPR